MHGPFVRGRGRRTGSAARHGGRPAGSTRPTAPYGRASRLKSEYIFGMALRLAGPRQADPAGPGDRGVEDWARQHDIVLWALPDSNAVQQVVDRYLLEVGAHALRRQEVCHVATVASLISAGMGMGFVPTFLADFYDRDTVGQIALPRVRRRSISIARATRPIRPPRPSTYSPGCWRPTAAPPRSAVSSGSRSGCRRR